MHIPISLGALKRRLTNVYSYFRTGVKVEGEAWLCDNGHPIAFHPDQPWPRATQHVDVELRFWNRRNERITVIDIVSARISTYALELTDQRGSGAFESVTLDAGDPPQESDFRLVPKHDLNARVEASAGALLAIEFRPSRGSERWARPRFTCNLGVRDHRT